MAKRRVYYEKIICVLFFAGCIAPEAETGHFVVELRNVCGFPVQVTVISYIEYPEDQAVNKQVNNGETIKTLDYFCAHCISGFFPDVGYTLLKKEFPNDYMLTIKANGQERILNSAQFLDAVKHAKHIPEKGDYWLINDPSLCPKP